MGRFFLDVRESVGSVFHVLDERVWRAVTWTVHSQQLAVIAREVFGGSQPQGGGGRHRSGPGGFGRVCGVRRDDGPGRALRSTDSLGSRSERCSWRRKHSQGRQRRKPRVREAGQVPGDFC